MRAALRDAVPGVLVYSAILSFTKGRRGLRGVSSAAVPGAAVAGAQFTEGDQLQVQLRLQLPGLLPQSVSSSLSLSSWNSLASSDFLEPMESSRCCRSRWKPSFCRLDLAAHTHQMMHAVTTSAVMEAAAKRQGKKTNI
ncbi:hypothetical protein EYF80_054888 [Liparis tanakae]|uniref:Uncharacterized protein n=1 Tax=Liparis tanakae TaxID=230148 RepID=A0A4Z2F233_9TELE|nr:hypothetical protein EYF80_054888 [Liparis tanakae]